MTDGVSAVEWSTCSEWVLKNGGCDEEIKFWDIRSGVVYFHFLSIIAFHF